MKLKELLEQFGIVGKVAIWPAGEYKTIGDQLEAVEYFPNIDFSVFEKHLDNNVLQMFADSDGYLNIVLY